MWRLEFRELTEAPIVIKKAKQGPRSTADSETEKLCVRKPYWRALQLKRGDTAVPESVNRVKSSPKEKGCSSEGEVLQVTRDGKAQHTRRARGKDALLDIVKELGVEVDITLPKIEFKKRICQSNYYNEESVKCLLECILEERRENKKGESKEREKLERELRGFEERKQMRELELERLRAKLRNKLKNKSSM
ncbi:hypothetical protein TNCV_3875531 [Trichonephila clavipes]|uniref:Uncharacterized protein n=1 Tax=Trichonephila clavipes TaxID=2585209 RepID=A0A8X6SW19_TRICX|nr:hypothetical protein TNCV_3875531 [Trichonephila clavipes]